MVHIRVGLGVGRPRYGTPVICFIVEGEGTERDVVCQRVPHFVAVLQIDVRTTNVVQDVVFDSAVVGPVDDDSALLRIFDCVSLEETIRAVSHLVKMHAVFPFDS